PLRGSRRRATRARPAPSLTLPRGGPPERGTDFSESPSPLCRRGEPTSASHPLPSAGEGTDFSESPSPVCRRGDRLQRVTLSRLRERVGVRADLARVAQRRASLLVALEDVAERGAVLFRRRREDPARQQVLDTRIERVERRRTVDAHALDAAGDADRDVDVDLAVRERRVA